MYYVEKPEKDKIIRHIYILFNLGFSAILNWKFEQELENGI
jgi:hypothetical protein